MEEYSTQQKQTFSQKPVSLNFLDLGHIEIRYAFNDITSYTL